MQVWGVERCATLRLVASTPTMMQSAAELSPTVSAASGVCF